MKKDFNIVILGVGGQGLITLLEILSEAALSEGYDVKTSELHGLAQRGGSVQVHIRFGKKIYSPMIAKGKADFILGLETQEILKGIYFANPNTKFLINQYIVPVPLEKLLSEEEVLKRAERFRENITLIPADVMCQEKFGTNVVAGVCLLGFATFKKMIPLKPSSIEKAIKKVVPEKHLDLNLQTFKIAKKD